MVEFKINPVVANFIFYLILDFDYVHLNFLCQRVIEVQFDGVCKHCKNFLAKNAFEPLQQAIYQLYCVNTAITLLPDIAIALLGSFFSNRLKFLV